MEVGELHKALVVGESIDGGEIVLVLVKRHPITGSLISQKRLALPMQEVVDMIEEDGEEFIPQVLRKDMS